MDISKVSARGVTDESLSSASDIVKAVTDGNDSASEEDSDDDDGEDEIDEKISGVGDREKQPPNENVPNHKPVHVGTPAPPQPFAFFGHPYMPNYPPFGANYAYPVAPPPVYPMPAQNHAVMAATGKKSNYVDHANIADPAPNPRRNRGGVTNPFPEVLHHMLTTLEKEGNGDIASFLTHGRAFAIHKPRLFLSTVMPRFFKLTKITSFQRQLNLYSFKRIVSGGVDNGGYWHPLFLRGRPGLCASMKRIKRKGKESKNDHAEGDDPNFYLYPPVGPSYAPPLSIYPPPTAPYTAYPAPYPPWPPYGFYGPPTNSGAVATATPPSLEIAAAPVPAAPPPLAEASVPASTKLRTNGYCPYPAYDQNYAFDWDAEKRNVPHPSPMQPIQKESGDGETEITPSKSAQSPTSVSDTPIRLLAKTNSAEELTKSQPCTGTARAETSTGIWDSPTK